jgi:TIR domain-containing protein
VALLLVPGFTIMGVHNFSPPMQPSGPVRIFISYAHKDGASLAQRLQSDLKKEGYDTWLDVQRIAGGAVWSADIEREIDTRQVTLALLSPGSYASEICRAEQASRPRQGQPSHSRAGGERF